MNKSIQLTNESGVLTWDELVVLVKNIPYGRNANRYDFSLVITENKGTCSSKHSFLKDFANKNNIQNVKLYIGMFKMNGTNTPKLGTFISDNYLPYIPEAHCYLKIDGIPVDVTTSESFYEKIESDILEEIEIQPEQVIDFKIEYHKKYLQNWIKETKQTKSFDEIWNIREKCIEKLAE